MLLREDLDVPQLNLQAGAVRIEQLEIAHHAPVIALEGQLRRPRRGSQRFGERRRLLAAVADLRQRRLHVADRTQDCLAVPGDGLLPGGLRLAHPRRDQSVAGQRQARTRPERPRPAVRREEGFEIAAQVARIPSEPHRRIISRHRHADVRVPRRHLTLGGGDVRPALQQVRRQSHRHRWGCVRAQGPFRELEPARRFPTQGSQLARGFLPQS